MNGRIAAWRRAAAVYWDRRILGIVVLGFASGLPLPLTFSTLSIWLAESGVAKAEIGLFALVGLPYAYKFLWAPAIDRLPLGPLTRRLGRRRGWMLAIQALLALAILALGRADPAISPAPTALAALAVAFLSASQDVAIDAYRVEILDGPQQGAGAGSIVFGYRLGMLAGGAGALFLAAALPWAWAYAAMAAAMLPAMATVLALREPATPPPAPAAGAAAWFREAALAPFAEFARRSGWPMLLLFVVLYKLGDSLAGTMANPFYLEMGFSKEEIASVSKLFGLVATLAGGFLGGLLVARWGLAASLVACGVLQAASNLMFAVQAMAGHDLPLLMVTIGFENLAGGMGTAAFVAFLSALCNASYTATQYALLSALAALPRTLLSSSAGFLAEEMAWVGFFLFTAAAALPGLWLAWRLAARLPERSPQRPSVPAEA